MYIKFLRTSKLLQRTVVDICLRKAGKREKQINVENGVPEDEFVASGDGTSLKGGFSSAFVL